MENKSEKLEIRLVYNQVQNFIPLAGNNTGFSSLLSNFTVVRTSQFSTSVTLLIVFVALPVLILFAYRRKKLIRVGKQYSVLDRAVSSCKPLNYSKLISTDIIFLVLDV